VSRRVFITLNEDVITELLRKAERRVCYAGPGIYDWAAEALISVSVYLGPENVTVIVDPDPFVVQVGYGTEQALRRLHDKGIPVRVQKGLRIGIVIADDFAAVFAPPALNVDVFPDAGIPNAICLSAEEAGRLLQAVVTGNQGNSTAEGLQDFAVENDEQEDNVPRIATLGEDLLEQSDLAKIRETLARHPPVSPDLDRQMRIINSTFQVVKITLKGAKLSQRKLPLRAEELGIEDADLRRRIGASFKLFETDVDSLTRGFQDDLDEIKQKYKLKAMGEIGHLVLSKDRADLENALRFFQKNLELAQEKLEEEIRKELDHSKDRLRQLFASKLQGDGQDQERLNRRLDSTLYRMKFPAAEEVLSNLGCDWYIFNLSEQMIERSDFAEKVKVLYGQPIEELIRIEPALGVKPAP
jgi:hypothetical protein